MLLQQCVCWWTALMRPNRPPPDPPDSRHPRLPRGARQKCTKTIIYISRSARTKRDRSKWISGVRLKRAPSGDARPDEGNLSRCQSASVYKTAHTHRSRRSPPGGAKLFGVREKLNARAEAVFRENIVLHNFLWQNNNRRARDFGCHAKRNRRERACSAFSLACCQTAR